MADIGFSQLHYLEHTDPCIDLTFNSLAPLHQRLQEEASALFPDSRHSLL